MHQDRLLIFLGHFTHYQQLRIIHRAFTLHKQRASLGIESSGMTAFQFALFI
jgi:hypothetical protein